MTATTAPPNANAGHSGPAARESRTKDCNYTSTSTATRKLTVWIKRPVRRGEGLNDWLFARAIHLAKSGATPESTAAVLGDLVGDQTRPGEIKRNVERAFEKVKGGTVAVGGTAGGKAAPKWPPRDDERLARLWEDHPATVADLAALSPATAPAHPLDVLRELHGAEGGELLCLGKDVTGGFETLPFSHWEKRRSEISWWPMCVPNLMRAAVGTNGDGKPSARCRDNSCGEDGQKWLVLEMDIPATAPVVAELGAAAPDVCAAVILHKLGLAQVRMVVRSGGKSLHAWLPASGRTQEQIERFYRTWCLFGGDHRGRLPEQQFRLPQGYRWDKGARQSVVYWNPEVRP